MVEGIADESKLKVTEETVLSKFDGEGTDPDKEVERLTIVDGTVVSHDVIKNREVVAPVAEKNLTGKDVGRFFPTE